MALARALLLQPPILILDDPTASVDPKTEHEIVSALRQAMTGRTAFVVANRLSLLRRADVILVLEKGRLARMGRHEELVRVPGIYRETALLQLMDLAGTQRQGSASRRAPIRQRQRSFPGRRDALPYVGYERSPFRQGRPGTRHASDKLGGAREAITYFRPMEDREADYAPLSARLIRRMFTYTRPYRPGATGCSS